MKIKYLNLAVLVGFISSPLTTFAGTVTVSATGLSSAPIFVTSALGSVPVGIEFYIGTFANVSALTSTINTYKAGVTGVGNTLAEAQADGASKKSLLYNQTVSWLQSSGNFTSFVASADTINQTGTVAAGKFLFNNSASRTVNGTSGTYAGSNGNFVVTYANYAPGLSSQLWAWFATGSEIAIVTDSTWIVPTNNASGLTIGTAALVSTGSGNPAELLLASYTDYASGSDLISSVAAPVTLEVVPEPSTGALMMIGAVGLVALRRLRKV
jgi:hypothetical protein